MRKCVEKYIETSHFKLQRINNVINSLPNKIIVWGAGSLTQRLLKTTNLGRKVLKLVDISDILVGKQLNGFEIISPDNLSNYKEPILISPFRFKKEIADEIKKRKLKNKIITL